MILLKANVEVARGAYLDNGKNDNTKINEVLLNSKLITRKRKFYFKSEVAENRVLARKMIKIM